VRMCSSNTSDILMRHVDRLETAGPLCSLDLKALEGQLADEVPWWNRIAPWFFFNDASVLARLARLDLDLELTAKLLDLRESRRRAGGEWPVSPKSIGDSRACPQVRWIYEVGSDGEMSIALDREKTWPDQMGTILPNRWTSRVPASSKPNSKPK
jgi:hypothetical protein